MPAPGWRGLCNATRRIRTNGAKLEQGLGKGPGCEAMKAPVGLSSGSTVCVANGGVSLRQVLDHVDSNFSSIENLWPQVDTCFRPFRATLKISEVEPQCTLKILQSKTCEKAKPLLMVTVHTERSSCPCLCSGVVRLAHRKCEVMAQYLVQTAYVRFKVQYEESRTQCGHYNLPLSSTRITLYSCAVNNQKQILED